MSIDHSAFTVALALGAGMSCQTLAHHLRVPGIVLLLLAGVLLGPEGLALLDPGLLGSGLHTMVGLSVAVILFEGGLSLNLRQLQRSAAVIRRLITYGALLTAGGACLVARFSLGWDWRVCALFGTLVIVTGPTVVTPLLRRFRLNRAVSTVLEAEGVLIDPVGAICAVVALELVLSSATSSNLGAGLLDVLGRMGFGFVMGLAGGLLLGLLLRGDKLVPPALRNVFTLSLVLTLFELCNAVRPESGIMGVTVAGLVVGNMKTHLERELREFKEQLTVMLIGMLFILLAADVRLEDVINLGYGGALCVALLMFAVRPLSVGFCTLGSKLTGRERLFMCWLAPRGVVAAAVAALFAQRLAAAGFVEGTALSALVFLVIALTVSIQGLSGAWVAGRLGVRRPQNSGWMLLGANPVARALATLLQEAGEDVVLVDVTAADCHAAEEEGLPVVFGNAHDERIQSQADLGGRKGFLAVTGNEGINLLHAQFVRDHFKKSELYVTLQRGTVGVGPDQVHAAGARVLFGGPADIALWSHHLSQKAAAMECWSFPSAGAETFVGDSETASGMLPLILVRAGLTLPYADGLTLQEDDRVVFAVEVARASEVRHVLQAAGWSPVSAEQA